MAQKAYSEVIEEVIAAWSQWAIEELRERAKNRKVELTGELIDSFSSKISKLTADGVAEMQIYFKTSGRFRDMEIGRYNKQGPAAVFAEWAEQVGIEKFKYVPGYGDKSRVPTTSIAYRRIGWGVAIARYTKGRIKSKRWFYKFFYGKLFDQLVDDMIEATGYSSVQMLQRELTEGL